MGSIMENLMKISKEESIKKMNVIKEHSFKLICNSLIKLLDDGNVNYKSGKYSYAFVRYMTVVNIFTDMLPKLRNFDGTLLEYNILKREIEASCDAMEKIKEIIKNQEEKTKSQQTRVSSTNSLSSSNTSRSNSNDNIASPTPPRNKTIESKKVYQYISRIESGEEKNPPRILLIDIREAKEYNNGHINFFNSNFTNTGVINIPLEYFYGMGVNINSLLAEVEKREPNEKKKALIRNLCESDLIIYYDQQSKVLNNQSYQIISDVLFCNNNTKKVKRPPVMLENGYQGWLQFIQSTGKSLEKYIESNNSIVDRVSKNFENMNINNQNNAYYLQYANAGTELMASSQIQNSTSNVPNASTNNTNPMTSTVNSSFYANIDVTPNVSTVGQPYYSPLESPQAVIQPPVNYNTPANPYNNYSLPINNQTPPAAYPIIPSHSISSQVIPNQSLPVIPPKPNYLSSSAASMNSNKVPPSIPERNGSKNPPNRPINETSSSSLNSINTYPIYHLNNGNGEPPKPPPKPLISPNEIHNKGHGTVGLRNLGNTCYMNSILQCLNATKPLSRFFLSGRFKDAINKENTLGTKGRLAMEYYNFLNTVWNEHLPVVSPTNIKDVISNFNNEFEGSDQHDSQEFLSCILDGLHEDLNVARKRTPKEIENIRNRHAQEEKREEKENISLQELQDNYWKRYIDFNYSIIVTTFQGQYMSSLTCSRCHKSSQTFNSLMFLSVPIPDNATDLYHCLDKYIEVEHLNGNDAWSCPNCKMKVSATKQLVLSKLPDIMMINLKRFYFQGPFRDKITKNITFPKYLDLEKYTYPFKCNDNNYKYKLFAISNHYGTLSGGHYTAFVKDNDNDNWISFDDSRISDISESKIMTNAAYILFYERVYQK